MMVSLRQGGFHHTLADTPNVSLVLFTSPECGSCRQLKALLPKLLETHTDWHLFEVDAQQEMGLTQEFEVFHLPTLFLYYEGQFYCELKAHASLVDIQDKVAQALKLPAEEAP